MYAANIQLGWIQKWFRGDDANEIMEQVEEYQDFDCLMRMGETHENAKGKKELAKLRAFVEKYYDRDLTIEDLRELNIHLSVGDFICTEIVEGQVAENVQI